MTDDICFYDASELAELIRSKKISAREILEAHLARIDKINPQVNAIVTMDAEQALVEADRADEKTIKGHNLGSLHGVPVAHKDLVDTAGMRTTYGSPIYADHVPEEDALIVQRLKEAGAISVGKTNTPEFGAGSQTFNQVFGKTLNPYDLTKTCGGSSGGAAVALATGMVALADGSDLGGSLRNPANFCNVVGLRPAVGRVPVRGSSSAWQNLSVQGPMARTVSDIALMLSVIAGPDINSPVALETPGSMFLAPLDKSFSGIRVAWSEDLGGLPIDQEIRQVVRSGASILSDLGCEVTEDAPDFTGADEAFMAWRGWSFGFMEDRLRDHRDQLKDTVIWNIEEGLSQSGRDLSKASELRSALYARVIAFFDHYEYLICPVSQVPPFSVETEWVSEIEGVEMETYMAWAKVCYFISATGLPAISVPAGFTGAGLPVGLQIIGRPRSEFEVLQLAYAFEGLTSYNKKHPNIVG
ncbi:MAG: amidase [Chloroflexi bacterium]|nr:amidase [Chloroflexota bacterium]